MCHVHLAVCIKSNKINVSTCSIKDKRILDKVIFGKSKEKLHSNKREFCVYVKRNFV